MPGFLLLPWPRASGELGLRAAVNHAIVQATSRTDGGQNEPEAEHQQSGTSAVQPETADAFVAVRRVCQCEEPAGYFVLSARQKVGRNFLKIM